MEGTQATRQPARPAVDVELTAADLGLLIKALERLTDSPSALDEQEWTGLISENLSDARLVLNKLREAR
jgi:hypothetical protein